MQNDWWTGLAERTQQYADMGDMCIFHEALKAVYGPSHQIQASLHSSDRSTLQTKKPSSSACQSVLKGSSSLAQIPQVDVRLELDDQPTREEIKKATMQPKLGKSPGTDGIPAEVSQCRRERGSA